MNDGKPMNPPEQSLHCPQCGTPLAVGSVAGLCPACLLQLGAAADTTVDRKQPSFVPPAPAELAPAFPQLEILEFIGKGGMGAVYKARQKPLDRVAALKILPPGIGEETAFAERFAREAKVLARLNHPGIVTLYEFGQVQLPTGGPPESAPASQPAEPAPHPPETTGHGRLYFFLMELVDGVNLRQLLHAGRLSAREALAIVPQICDALQYAHDQGIVHRDIKPENILLDRRGRVKVADFGLVKIIQGRDAPPGRPTAEGPPQAAEPAVPANLTDAGKVMGTPHYMAPEQVEHPTEVDHRADIYALGVVFYQMLTGELPGKPLEPPSKKVQVDVRLDEVVLRALETNRELRYQQASVLKTHLETIATDPAESGIHRSTVDPAPVPPQPQSKPAGKPLWSRDWIKALAIVAAVVLAVIAIPPAVTFLSLSVLNWTRTESNISPAAVVAVEQKLRSQIEQRLQAENYRLENLSVNVSPNLRRAECQFSRFRKNQLALEPQPHAAIRLKSQGNGLWNVRGEGEFRSLRFSVDTSSEMKIETKTPAPTNEQAEAASRLGNQALQFRLVAAEDSPDPIDLLSDPNDRTGQRQLRVLREVVADGSDVATAGLAFQPDGQRAILVQLTEDGSRRFAALTAKHINRSLAIVFRGHVINAPVIRSPISGGRLTITGRWSGAEVHEIVDSLNREPQPTTNSWRLTRPIDILLPEAAATNFVLFDLDSERWATNSMLRPDLRESRDWLRATGVDLLALRQIALHPVITGYDMVLVQAPTNAWETVTAADLVRCVTLSDLSPRQEINRAGQTDAGNAFLFLTREGGRGLLEILGFEDNGRGVKIRYTRACRAWSSPDPP